MSAREAWAPNGWRDPVGDRPEAYEMILMLVKTPQGNFVRSGWIERDVSGDDEAWMSTEHNYSEPVEHNGIRVIGWQYDIADCETPASKSNDTTEARR